MLIEYTAKPSDVAALYSYTRRHSVKHAVFSYGLPVAIGGLLLAEIWSLTHSLTLTDWIIAIVWGVLFYFLFPLFLRLRTKKSMRTLSIGPDKLSTRAGKLSGEVPWIKMANLSVTDEHVFLVGRNMNGFAIPRRAFVDENQRKEFIRLCEHYIQAARS